MSGEHRKRIFSNPSSAVKHQKYQFKFAWASAPHPQKAQKGGEDALYASPNVLIVADGVSAWSSVGIDSGIYSKRLIALAKELIESQNKMFFIENPQQLAISVVQKNTEKGSSTLFILTLHPYTGILKSYHVGDSIFGLFSKNKPTILAQEQQSSFNVPYQVFGGTINIIKNDDKMASSQQVCDVFRGISAQYTLQGLKESFIVLASDGLWDNLHQKHIERQLLDCGSGDLVEKTVNLMNKAKYYSDLESYDSPFYQKAVNCGHNASRCGKVDDTTVILAEVMLVEQIYQIVF